MIVRALSRGTKRPDQARGAWSARGFMVGASVSIVLSLSACQPEDDLISYRLATVSLRDVVVSARAEGVVEPIRTIEVKSKASGEIFRMPVEVGDAVRAGDLLVQVDPRIPQATVRQAEADLERARTQLDIATSQMVRADDLHATQAITEQEYENARLSVAQGRASLVRAERTLEDARIAAEDTDVRAPIHGVIIVKRVEQGTVITSATSRNSSGAVLLTMANLDTVQVRALVPETDIGKVEPGMDVTVTVQAYAERPFRGSVLKIEPLSVEQQNVTMFPVLMRLPNTEGLLRPGMNSGVEVHVGQQQNVLTVPNTALRTDRDYLSVAALLGLEEEGLRQQLADAQAGRRAGTRDSTARRGAGTAHAGGGATVSFRGREIGVPDGVDVEAVRAIIAKLEGGGGFRSLTPEDRQVLQQLGLGGRSGGGGQRPGGRGSGGRGRRTDDSYLFGGSYVVYVMRDGIPAPVPVTTGLTDMHYSQVVSGLSDGDTVLVLPSASLLSSQQQWQERIQRITGRGVPGISRN